MQDHVALLASIAHQAMIDRGLEPDFSKAAEKQLATINAPANENSVRDLRKQLVDATCYEKSDLTTNGDATDVYPTTPPDNSATFSP